MMNNKPLPPVPFQVKVFPALVPGYEYNAPRTKFDVVMNQWFAALAQDGNNQYDIRQILPMEGGGIMVFYEVTPLTSRELPCGTVCDTCGTSLYLIHECTRCDALPSEE